MHSYQDRLVEGAGSCRLAIRDYGGDGTPVLLLHGSTRTLADWEPVTRGLVAHHRVVAMELRNHGHSGDGAWEWEAVLEDVRFVTAATGLERPAIVGHSLGGMIAALYSASGGECLCVVNLDGYGRGRIDQYVGIASEEVRAYWRGTIQEIRARWQDAAGPLGVEGICAYRTVVAAEASLYRIPGHVVTSGLERSTRRIPGGKYLVRPSLDSLVELNSALPEVDWFAAFHQTKTPILIYNCVGSDPGIPSRWGAQVSAYRRGLQRDLAVLAHEVSHVSVRTLDADHMLIVNMPKTVSAEIHQYVQSIAGFHVVSG